MDDPPNTLLGQIRIRNVTLNDIADFIECYSISYSRDLVEYSYSKRSRIKKYFKWLLKKDKNGFFVVEINNRKVAFLACDKNYFSKKENKRVLEIHEFFVIPEFRGIGIGSLLLNIAIEYAKLNNLDTIELTVGENNEKAIVFYEKKGFIKKENVNKWVRMVKII